MSGTPDAPAAAGELPVVFLAFANASEAHLGLLKTESRQVFDALKPLQESGRLVIHREESCEFGELYDDLVTHVDRLVILHYGGHANGQLLQFEGGGGGREGLAGLLGQQRGLKLVFLNGCATQGHVKTLLDAGVPAVIATSVPIGDQKAQELSTAFYAALAKGQNIPSAFKASCDFIQGKYGTGKGTVPGFTTATRQVGDDDEAATESAVVAWSLFTRPDSAADLEQWRLPDARAAWRVQLADARGPIRSLDGQPLVLDERSPSRTVAGIACKSCRISTTAAKGQDPTCPVCGSTDVERTALRTMIGSRLVRFGITEAQARTAALDHAAPRQKSGSASATLDRLSRVFLPYWIFDIDTHTTVEAQRGTAGDLTAVVPQIEWETVKDEIDLTRTQLVPAGATPSHLGASPGNWSWNPAEADEITRLDDIEAPIVPLDRSLQSAFDQVVSDVDRELQGQVVERVGGLYQNNITTDTRYRRVEARTVWLPHWYATVERDGERMNIVINGQTGAVRALPLPGTQAPADGKASTMSARIYEGTSSPPGPSVAVSVFSGVGIGLMVGAMLGLAAPSGDGRSLVAYFIAAVGSGLAALLGLNDSHFSVAKGMRIGAFGLAALVAAPTGIYVRAHNLLGTDPPPVPTLTERMQEYLAVGFTQEQALEFLKPVAQASALQTRQASTGTEAGPQQASGQGALFGAYGTKDYQTLLGPENFNDNVDETLKAFDRQGEPFHTFADVIRSNVPAGQRLAAIKAVLRNVCQDQHQDDKSYTCG